MTGGGDYDVIDYIMDYKQAKEDTDYSVRTQISLSKSLYRLVKQWAKREGESMSAIVRRALVEQMQQQEEDKKAKKERLAKLADKARGMIKPGDGGWGDVKDPNKLIRSWREEEERELSKRLGWDE